MADMRGLDRRAQVTDPNAGAANAPVNVSGVPQTPILSPRLPSAKHIGAEARMAAQLAKYAGEKIAQVADKKLAKDRVDGEIAYAQGKTYEELESEGAAPHTVAAYRMMDAQTAASDLFHEQMEAITAKDHELDPNEYRQVLGGRLEQALEGKDKLTGRLISEFAAKQMPALAEAQVQQHQQYLSKETFRSLSNAVAGVSKDPTSHDTLVFMASGVPGTPAASMSADRRKEAILSGISKAFAQDNPAAFALLDQTGTLKKLNLDPDEINQLHAARNAFENRTRRRFDADYTNKVRNVNKLLKAGSINLQTAINKVSEAHAERGWELRNVDVGGLYQLDDKRREAAAAARAAKINAARKAAQKGSEMRAYLQLKLRQVDNEAAFRSGAMDATAFLEKSFKDYNELGVKINKSAVNSVVSEVEKWQKGLEKDAAARKKRHAEFYAGLESDLQEANSEALKEFQSANADAKQEEAEAQYSRLMVQPKIDFQLKRISPEQFYNAHESAVEQSGIPFNAADLEALDRTVVGNIVKHEQESLRLQAETTAIEEAISTGTVSSLPTDLQSRVFDVAREQFAEKYSEAMNNPELAQQAAAAFQEDMVDFAADVGVVDKKMQARVRAALNTNPLDDNGKVTPQAVAAFDFVSELNERNPVLAGKYLDEPARALVQMADTMSTNGANGSAEALQTAAIALKNGDVEQVAARLSTPEAREEIAKSADEFITSQNISFFGALFDPNSEISQMRDIMGVDEESLLQQASRLHDVVERQATAVMYRNPGISVSDAIKVAGQDVEDRVAAFGPDLVILPPGQNIREKMFGDRAEDFKMTAVPTNALMNYLRQAGSTEQMWGEDFGSSSAWQMISTLVAGSDEELNTLKNTTLRGVPEIVVRQAPDGMGADSGLMVTYKKTNGELSPDWRHIKYRDMGDLWIEHRKGLLE